MKKGKREK